MATDKKFRIKLFQLSQRMNKADIEAIVFTERLSTDTKEQSALDVLMKLDMLGKINGSNPSTVEQIFRNINREDLADEVKTFKKSKPKKNTPTSEADMLLKLQANLEVAAAQHRLLLDQLKEVKRLSELVRANQLTEDISQVAQNTQYNMETLMHGKDFLRPEDVLSDSSTESENSFQPPPAPPKAAQQGSFDMRELQQSVLKRKDPRESSPKESPSPLPRRVITPVQEESLYAEVIHTQLCIRESNSAIGQFSSNNPPPPRSPGNSGRRGSSLVVTEQSGKSPAVSRKTAVKPAPPPKPTPPPRPPKPSQTKQREAQVYVPVVVEEEEDSTAGTTGDSGFSEASDFLRVNLPSPHFARVREEPRASNMANTLTPAVSTTGYMPIQKEQVQHVSYYKSSNRQQQFQKYLDVYTEGDTASTTKGSGNGSTNTL